MEALMVETSLSYAYDHHVISIFHEGNIVVTGLTPDGNVIRR